MSSRPALLHRQQRGFRGRAGRLPEAIKESTVCSLARANDRDISRCRRGTAAGCTLAHPYLHRHVSRTAHGEEAAYDARAGVRAGQAGRALCPQPVRTTLSSLPEDGYRSDPDFLCRVFETVIAEGATTINVPDTVGYAVPELYGAFIRESARSASPTPTRRSGRSTATTTSAWRWPIRMAGVKIGGARQIECTINGLGERAGNCSRSRRS
jgi:2-isopropylmalate synthase